jgi:shikimate 5-dehydrogenase
LKSTVVEPPLFEELSGLDVLLVGAGGAARAVAFYLAEEIGPGRLFIANRTQAKAAALASAVDDAYGNATAIGADEVEDVAARVRLIVNSSTRGQAGFRTLDDGAVTTLEPYSALAPAQPTNVPVDSDPESGTALQQWFEASLPDILRNNEKSLRIAGRVAASVPAYDLVYAPTETVFMRHFRYSGHRVVNGKGMNVAQAVDGFCDRVCGDYLKTHGLDGGAVRDRVAQEMIRVW